MLRCCFTGFRAVTATVAVTVLTYLCFRAVGVPVSLPMLPSGPAASGSSLVVAPTTPEPAPAAEPATIAAPQPPSQTLTVALVTYKQAPPKPRSHRARAGHKKARHIQA